jgi:type II secretory pathway component PulF
MPTFEYRAVREDGQRVTGTVLSSTLDQAVLELTGKGLQLEHIGAALLHNDPLASQPPSAPPRQEERPVEVPRAEQMGNPYELPRADERPPEEDPLLRERSYVEHSVVGPLVGRVPLSQLLFFFRQLATMLGAGVGITHSLDTLARQSKYPKLKTIIEELRTHVLAGRPISAGLQRYPEVFSPLMLSLVRAGEGGGVLEQSLSQVADYIEQEIELRNLLRRVTIYPKIVIVASIVIILGANAIISSVGGTNFLSSPLTNPVTWIFLGPLIVLLFLFTRLGLQNPRVKFNYDLVLSNLPGFGNVIRQFSMAKFGRGFGALYRGGVPIVQAVKLAADACGNEYLRARIHPAAERLKEGVGITETFRETGAFSPIVLEMTATGEMTGNLDHMLGKMSEFYEGEAQTRAVQFGYIFGVLCLLAVCIYVGYVVITFYVGHFTRLTDQINMLFYFWRL